MDNQLTAFGQHRRGRQVDVRHMCPECGGNRRLILPCAWCGMEGSVTTEQLDRWVAHQNLVNR